MLKELSNTDYELFFKLSSIYHALILSSVDPVVVPFSPEREDNVGIFTHVFWDAHEDKSYAVKIINDRIKKYPKLIKSHHKYYESMRDSFYLIQEFIPENDRKLIAKNSRTLIDSLKNYRNLVENHQDTARPFLHYPTCLRGHYFLIDGDDRIKENSFNPHQTKLGLEKEIRYIYRLLSFFPTISDNISHVKLSHEFDSGTGFSDTSLRGRVELNKELLKRAGFDI